MHIVVPVIAMAMTEDDGDDGDNDDSVYDVRGDSGDVVVGGSDDGTHRGPRLQV